jgi:arylsulfatase A-like enzyme
MARGVAPAHDAIMRKPFRVCAGLLIVSATIAWVPVSAQTASGAPNIVVIMTDDQRWDTLSRMPNVQALLQQQGTTYTNGFVPNSLCCPSRATTLTGLNARTTGVYSNTPPFGGFASFKDQTTIATVLRGQAGYRTMFVGKYLNGYLGGRYGYVPPGWDRWFSIAGGRYYSYYAADNGRKSPLYGTGPEAYSGRVLTTKAIDYVTTAPTTSPFFLFYAPVAPHAAQNQAYAIPDPRDVGVLEALPGARPPSYGFKDSVADMPAYNQANGWNVNGVDRFRRRQLEAVIGVDRNIGELMAVLPANTLVIFMSDNGFMWAEHKWHYKSAPYEESIRIPLVVRWDGVVAAGATDPRLALNVDIAPTIATAAGIDVSTTPLGLDRNGVPRLTEGLDLLGASTRSSFVLEHYENQSKVPPYCGIRTEDGWMYTRYWDGRTTIADNGFEELYHVAVDPYQLTNLVTDPSAADTLSTLRALTRERCSPAPPYYVWPT